MTEYQDVVLTRQKFTGPLTRDSYAACMILRQPGEVGRGFTIDGLAAMGIIDQPDLEDPGAEAFVRRDDDEEVNGYLIRTRMQGKFPRFSVYSTDGRLLRNREFGKRDQALEFIATLQT